MPAGLETDELAIRALVSRYCDAVARRDLAAWGDTFAEDGVWEVLGRRAEGRAPAVSLLEKLLETVTWVIQVPDFGLVEEIDGDRAGGRWYIHEWLRFADGRPALNIGVYQDRYRRTPEGWRFAHRRFSPLYMGPPDLSAEPLPFPADREE